MKQIITELITGFLMGVGIGTCLNFVFGRTINKFKGYIDERRTK